MLNDGLMMAEGSARAEMGSKLLQSGDRRGKRPKIVMTLCDNGCTSREHQGLQEQQGMSENLFLKVLGKCLQGDVV